MELLNASLSNFQRSSGSLYELDPQLYVLKMMITMNQRYYFVLTHVFVLQTLLHLNLAVAGSISVPAVEEDDIKCIASERQALLSFKQGLTDSNAMLSSWRSEVEDCCKFWKGVHCCNRTGHVVKLILRGSRSQSLGGNISPSLLKLSHLRELDLSNNKFNQTPIPEFIGSLASLQKLNLSFSEFLGAIPPHIGNLSELQSIDLGWDLMQSNSGGLEWIHRLSSLTYLQLSNVNLGGRRDWVAVFGKLPHLQELLLTHCNLPQPILTSDSYVNFSRHLIKLDLYDNNLNPSIYPWVFNFSLMHLDLDANNLPGLIPDGLGNMTSLEEVDLSYNNFEGASPNSFRNLCRLRSLFLAGNKLTGSLSAFLKLLPDCALSSLKYLHLPSNHFTGQLPELSVLTSLKELDLSGNRFKGEVPESLGQLSNLEHLNLGGNLLEGEISQGHFSNLTRLQDLNLSENSNLVLKFQEDWNPPFQLDTLFLRSCRIGQRFPNWLKTQTFSDLDISNGNISDYVPNWFWKSFSLELEFMDLSANELKGEIPDFPIKLKEDVEINFSSNKFEGRIPKFLFQATILVLSNNRFSEAALLCNIINPSPLLVFDISNNQLATQLPNCWENVRNLSFLSLANNNLLGGIPSSLENLTKLKFLHLRNNHFSEELPSWLQNLTNLIVFDVDDNQFSGPIPAWIGGNLSNLLILSLRLNHFNGSIPSNLCNLKEVRVLDLSSNFISGSIPSCLHNLTALTQSSTSQDLTLKLEHYIVRELDLHFGLDFKSTYIDELIMVWKGTERKIKQSLKYYKILDLSRNRLTGEIPEEITGLIGLKSLNLSTNNLTGKIPHKIGQLQNLESLDLSKNQLSGHIPSSLSQINWFGTLDLSYNNLSGKIPTGPQLQRFDASSYKGNVNLCGAPLKDCLGKETTPNKDHSHKHETKDDFLTSDIRLSVVAGFVVGFWGICGSLMFCKTSRRAYVRLLKDVSDGFYVASRVHFHRLPRLFRTY